MKKIVMLLGLLALALALAIPAMAEPKELPDSCKVVVIKRSTNITTWAIRGPITVLGVEIYGGMSVKRADLTKKKTGGINFTQKRGTRWNFLWKDKTGGPYYAFFSVENNETPLPWMSKDVGVIDGPNGASLTDRRFMRK